MGVDVSETVNFQVLGGSFFQPETMEPLADRFRRAGHSAEVAYDMPTQDGTATAEDHARALANRLRGLARVVLVTYSRSSGIAERALEILEQEGVESPVELAVSISGSHGPLPDAATGTTIPRPRNTQKFRDGLEQMPDGRTRFRREMALDVFFNVSHNVGHLAVPGMVPDFRVEAPPMPDKLRAPWLVLFPRYDAVRDFESVLDMVWYYRNGPNKMHLRITEGDHGVPMAEAPYIGDVIMDHCVRIGIMPPVSFETAGALPLQRRPTEDSRTNANPS